MTAEPTPDRPPAVGVGGLVEVEVHGIAAGGEGVGRDRSGRVVFVPRTAPGDRARAEVVRDAGSWARARLVQLLHEGPRRADPPCPHFAECGGCELQHLAPEAQREALRQGVADALERIGGVRTPVRPVEPAPARFGYRNRVTFTLRREDGRVRAGYHARLPPSPLLEIDHCPLAEPPVAEAWRRLRTAWGPGAAALPGGEELRLTLRASAHGRVALFVRTSRGGEGGGSGDPEAIRGALELESYWWKAEGAARRLLAGAPTFADRWEGFDLRLEPEAFLQVNRAVAERIERRLDEGLGAPAGLRILDLYAGVGLRSLRWGSAGAEAVACERDPDAVRSGRDAARRHGVPARFVRGDVEERLPSLLPSDVVVVNPPRAGLSRAAARALVAGVAGRLAYVSCDPATLARDLRRLRPAWEVVSVQPFDAFPNTGHVETLVWLDRVADATPSPEGGREGGP